jgi:hypothetical protein
LTASSRRKRIALRVPLAYRFGNGAASSHWAVSTTDCF